MKVVFYIVITVLGLAFGFFAGTGVSHFLEKCTSESVCGCGCGKSLKDCHCPTIPSCAFHPLPGHPLPGAEKE